MHIPFAGRNTKYNAQIGRPRLLVLNKMDLTDMSQAQVILTVTVFMEVYLELVITY